MRCFVFRRIILHGAVGGEVRSEHFSISPFHRLVELSKPALEECTAALLPMTIEGRNGFTQSGLRTGGWSASKCSFTMVIREFNINVVCGSLFTVPLLPTNSCLPSNATQSSKRMIGEFVGWIMRATYGTGHHMAIPPGRGREKSSMARKSAMLDIRSMFRHEKKYCIE